MEKQAVQFGTAGDKKRCTMLRSWGELEVLCFHAVLCLMVFANRLSKPTCQGKEEG